MSKTDQRFKTYLSRFTSDELMHQTLKKILNISSSIFDRELTGQIKWQIPFWWPVLYVGIKQKKVYIGCVNKGYVPLRLLHRANRIGVEVVRFEFEPKEGIDWVFIEELLVGMYEGWKTMNGTVKYKKLSGRKS